MVFPSVQEACEALGIKSKDAIYKAIKYGLLAKGYRWRYLNTPLTPPQSYAMRLKPVIVSKDDIDIEYPSIVEASKATGASVSHIQQAIITGGLAKGFRFRLAGVKPKPNQGRHHKTVIAFDDKGHIVKRWGSVKEAAIDLGVIGAAIYWAVNPKHPNATCKGYRLRYEDD